MCLFEGFLLPHSMLGTVSAIYTFISFPTAGVKRGMLFVVRVVVVFSVLLLLHKSLRILH